MFNFNNQPIDITPYYEFKCHNQLDDTFKLSNTGRGIIKLKCGKEFFVTLHDAHGNQLKNFSAETWKAIVEKSVAILVQKNKFDAQQQPTFKIAQIEKQKIATSQDGQNFTEEANDVNTQNSFSEMQKLCAQRIHESQLATVVLQQQQPSLNPLPFAPPASTSAPIPSPGVTQPLADYERAKAATLAGLAFTSRNEEFIRKVEQQNPSPRNVKELIEQIENQYPAHLAEVKQQVYAFPFTANEGYKNRLKCEEELQEARIAVRLQEDLKKQLTKKFDQFLLTYTDNMINQHAQNPIYKDKIESTDDLNELNTAIDAMLTTFTLVNFKILTSNPDFKDLENTCNGKLEATVYKQFFSDRIKHYRQNHPKGIVNNMMYYGLNGIKGLWNRGYQVVSNI